MDRPEPAASRRRVPRPRLPARVGTIVPGSGLLGLSSTRRAVVLAVVVCALALSVAVPLRNYLAQRSELAEVQQQQTRLREQVDELEQRRQQLSDPAQVEAEARRRLRYVKPGETPYIVQLPGQTTTPPAATEPPAEQPDEQAQPWYSDLWRSAAGADANR